MLTKTDGDIIVRAQVNVPKEIMKIKGRLGSEGCKRFHSMIEAARAFVLAALLIN
jgi:hypothetical protein